MIRRYYKVLMTHVQLSLLEFYSILETKYLTILRKFTKSIVSST